MLEAGEFEEESFLEGGRERGREGGEREEGGRKGGREGGREGKREGGREGGKEKERGKGREGGIHAVRTLVVYLVSLQVAQSLSYSLLHGNHLTAQSAVILEERYREGRMYRYMCK